MIEVITNHAYLFISKTKKETLHIRKIHVIQEIELPLRYFNTTVKSEW